MPFEDELRINGSLVLEHYRVLVERFGGVLLGECVESLQEGQRAELGKALPAVFVPFSTVEALVGAVSRRLSRSAIDLERDIGPLAFERVLRAYWSEAGAFKSDQVLFARSPTLFTRSYDRGQVITRVLGPGRAELLLSKWPRVSEFPIQSLQSAVIAVLRVAGRTAVNVEIAERFADGARFIATWSSA